MPDHLRQKRGCHLRRHGAHNFAKSAIGLEWRAPVRDKPFREIRNIWKLSYLVSRNSLKAVWCLAQLVGRGETGTEVGLAKSEAGPGVKLTCLRPFCQSGGQDLEKVSRSRLFVFVVHTRLVQDPRHERKTVVGAFRVSIGQSIDEFQNRFGVKGKRRRPSVRPQQRFSRITCG